MIDASLKKLTKLKNSFKQKRVVVVGDMMLDYYFWGKINRISPEAPVPVVEIENEFARFGGAMNVTYNLRTLGAESIPVGVIGNDQQGKDLLKLMKDSGIKSKGIFVDNKRPTTAKSRVIAGNQHVVRIDKENTGAIPVQLEKKIISFLLKEIKRIDAIILEDYNKGVLSKNLIEKVIALATKHNKIITVDPKFNNFFSYQDVTVFKPNRKETEDIFGIKIRSAADISFAGNKLLEKLNCKFALLTLGEEGIALFERGKPERRVPTKARKVADVSGAGDTVISTLTMALASGADIYDATYLANYAGGLVCEEVGIVPIELDILFNAVKEELI